MPDTLLGFDFGERRIGVAVGNTLVGIAHPLQTIDTESNDERFKRIASLIEEWQPDALVVGGVYLFSLMHRNQELAIAASKAPIIFSHSSARTPAEIAASPRARTVYLGEKFRLDDTAAER